MRTLLIMLLSAIALSAQTPPIEPGVSHELAKWRAARYSDVRYKLNLTLEKMSPVLKGTMEIRVKLSEPLAAKGEPPASAGGFNPEQNATPIILDWRRIRGSESLSTISNVSINGIPLPTSKPPADAGGSPLEQNEHLIFRDGVVLGENVIKLDFTSPILTSGSAITRYVDKEDGAEYIYSLFVPSDASTAFPVFDQPDLKARFSMDVRTPELDWTLVSNTTATKHRYDFGAGLGGLSPTVGNLFSFPETKPISTYVFAFAAGPFAELGDADSGSTYVSQSVREAYRKFLSNDISILMSTKEGDEWKKWAEDRRREEAEKKKSTPDFTRLYVRESQAAKFKPHAAEVFRLNREGIKFLEQYFDYKFPFPKYDLVLIPEFPFGGMEHAGATFLREASIIFPQEPTKSDHISRANLIFHEAAHQWFGDTVTMKWFDDLWLKEGFAEFMAYKTLEKVMPEANAWKVFYERNKQAAYLTDSTKGTTPIYQEITNLSAAKSAYGNIVYRKAPSFLKQAEFYLGAEKFQTAVRAFLKKYEYRNAGWEDLVKEFVKTGYRPLTDSMGLKDADVALYMDSERVRIEDWARIWVHQPGLPGFTVSRFNEPSIKTDPPGINRGLTTGVSFSQSVEVGRRISWPMRLNALFRYTNGTSEIKSMDFEAPEKLSIGYFRDLKTLQFVFPNYQDHGYGIFLLDAKSRDYVLKNIGSEKDDFLRSMMWGSLWDSVREGELDPKDYVELAIRNLPTEKDETIVASILGRVSTAMNYYVSEKGEPPASAGGLPRPTTNSVKPKRSNANAQPPANAGGSPQRLEAVLLDRLQNASTPGQRITFYRAFVANASTAKGREVLKEMLRQGKGEPPASAGGSGRATTRSGKTTPANTNAKPPANAGGSPLRTKDRFDIVQRLIILGDPDALKLLADLEKTETSDDAKRYAYAARAGIATAENKAKYWNDFVNNASLSESWIEAAFGPWNSIRHSGLTLPYLQKALQELPNHKRNRKIFFVNGWLGAFIGGQRSEEALNIVNKFLADNPNLDRDLRLKILENVDLIERAVKIRGKYGN